MCYTNTPILPLLVIPMPVYLESATICRHPPKQIELNREKHCIGYLLYVSVGIDAWGYMPSTDICRQSNKVRLGERGAAGHAKNLDLGMALNATIFWNIACNIFSKRFTPTMVSATILVQTYSVRVRDYILAAEKYLLGFYSTKS